MQTIKSFLQGKHFWIALSFITPPLLAAILYGRVLSFPFFLDDDLNFTWMRGRSLLSYWVNSSGYKYYRPITFGMWRLTQTLFGETNTVTFQAINFTILILVGWLVNYLAAYLNRDGKNLNGVAATLAGAVAITFPFLPQSISNVAQGFYFYIAFAFLACFVAFVRYRQTTKLRWAILTIIIGILAPAIHENLIVIGGLLFVWLVIDQEQRKPQDSTIDMSFRGALFATRNLLEPFQRFIAPALSKVEGSLGMTNFQVVLIPFTVTLGNVLWFLLWLQIPKVKGDGLGWVGWTSLIQSIAFFLQGLTFPLQPLARVMMEYGWSDVTAALTLGVIGLILLSAILIWRGKWRILLIGLAWYTLNAAPMILGLGFHYMISNMRFLVSPVPAVALLWGSVIVVILQISNRFVRYSSLVIGLFIIIIPSVFIIQESMDLHAMSLNSVHNLSEIAQTNPTQSHLIINPIDWIASNKPRYAMGHETVEILPSYLTLGGLVYTNVGQWVKIDGIIFNNIKPELKKYWYSLAAVEEVDWQGMATRLPNYDRVWLTRYSDEQVDIVEAGKVELNAPKTFANHNASFDGKILLVSAQTEMVKNDMRLTLSWYVTNPIQGEAFRHVTDCEGNVLGLGDGPALGGVYPVWLWRAQDRITDVRYIPLEKLSTCYRIEIGLYNPSTGQRLPVFDPQGARLANDVLIIEKK